MARRKERKKAQRGRVADRAERKRPGRNRLPGVPPPDHAIWPEQYRGRRWKPIYGLLFAVKCQLCAYSCPLPKSRQQLDQWYCHTRLLLCTNHPRSPGELCEVLPMDTCRNFKAKRWHLPRTQPAKKLPPPPSESDPNVRRIYLSDGLFAIVDAEDYDELSKYKWRASHHGRTVYATCVRRGRVVYMHRMIMKARKGVLVDHSDGNGLNNRRCNLRRCTHQQNRANVGPRGGVSGFVGVCRSKDKWAARVTSRGKYYHVGTFGDPVEAAIARDRKAYELFGEHAYINRPEDLARWLRESDPRVPRHLKRREARQK